MAYWDTDPQENVFLEVTRRTDIGGDLEAPLSARGGGATGSYVLVPEVRDGDVVVHYDGNRESIVGASVAVGGPQPATTWWVARGSSARTHGATAQWLPGVTVPLRHFTPVTPQIALSEVRQKQNAVMAVKSRLEGLHPGIPLYFPWVTYGTGPIRTFQTYLAKLPQEVIDLFPAIRVAINGAVASRAGQVPPVSPVIFAEDAVAEAAGSGRPGRGQGFAIDQKVKVSVEALSMNAATAHFEAAGWEVEDVHGVESFDLRCVKADKEKHVEVKGTTTSGDEVILTPNEVEHAKNWPDLALFVLANIVATSDIDGNVSASGGQIVTRDPWVLGDGTLKPLGFRYLIPRSPKP